VEETFWGAVWAKMKTIWKWMAVNLAAPGVAVLVVVLAVVLMAAGWKELQIGGLLSWLFGKDTSTKKKALDVINKPSPKRVDANGNIILPGTPDSKGQTQAQVVPIQEPGLFSNPDTIKFTPPGEDKPVEVVLPDGVSNRDVDTVVVVQPGEFAVVVKDSSSVKGKTLDELLAKYRGRT
jgi:hypothetical protein